MSDEEQYEYEEEYTNAYIVPERDDINMKALLDQKDNDLMLAAELGKALLEKNAELERRQEQSLEEYNQKIEEIEQDKYALHLKYENLEGEYENTAKELQYDISQLKDELGKAKHETHAEEKDKFARIRELTQQNERLLEELQQATYREEQYSNELQHLRDQSLLELSAKQAAQIEHLQEQVTTLSSHHSQLERHLEKISEEKESLVNLVDESHDRIKVLERQKNEQESEVQQKGQEIQELHERNSHLTAQIENMTEKASNSSGHSMTLFNELSQMSTSNNELSMADSPINPYPPSMFGDELIECDDDDDYIMTSSSPAQFLDERIFSDHQEQTKMESEILSAYRQMRQICKDIRTQMGDKIPEDHDSTASEDNGSLNDVVLELKEVIHTVMDKANHTQSNHLAEIHCLQERVGHLEQDLQVCQTSLHKFREQLDHRDAQLQQRTHKVNELSRQVSSQHEDIKILSSQRDKLQDMMAGDKGKPQMYSAMALLRHARRERDNSNDRRFSLEKELQQSRYEAIVLNHQLLEAIQQKNKVSSLLDQWQGDMADLLGVQMDKHIQDTLKEVGAVGGKQSTDNNTT